MLIKTDTDAGAYILGILWGVGSRNNEGYLFRHKDRWYLDALCKYTQAGTSIWRQQVSSGEQWVIKVCAKNEKAALDTLLSAHGWTPRNNSIRDYPFGAIDDRGFIRAWIELHGRTDLCRAQTRKGSAYLRPRLRIYGNGALLTEINHVLARACGLQVRKLQSTCGPVTKTLYYQGKSVAPVLDWIYAGSTLYNEQAREKLYKEAL